MIASANSVAKYVCSIRLSLEVSSLIVGAYVQIRVKCTEANEDFSEFLQNFHIVTLTCSWS